MAELNEYWYVVVCRMALQTLAKTKNDMMEEKRLALSTLAKKKEMEKVEAVKVAHVQEQEIRQNQIESLKREHSLEIEKHIQDQKGIDSQISGRDNEIAEVQRKREQIYDELIKVQADFQNFIDRSPLFDSGQTGYLLRDIRANPNVINPYKEAAAANKGGKTKGKSTS